MSDKAGKSPRSQAAWKAGCTETYLEKRNHFSSYHSKKKNQYFTGQRWSSMQSCLGIRYVSKAVWCWLKSHTWPWTLSASGLCDLRGGDTVEKNQNKAVDIATGVLFQVVCCESESLVLWPFNKEQKAMAFKARAWCHSVTQRMVQEKDFYIAC